MTTTLRVLLDPVTAPVPGGIGRYTEELARALIEVAPDGCAVAGVIPRSPAEDRERLTTLLPGLEELIELPLPRRELHLAWRAGVTTFPGRTGNGEIRSAKGMLHSANAVAPLGRHDRINEPGNQTVVTVHDVTAWTHPDALPKGRAALLRAMVKRAHRYADAVITPTHAVAEQLNETHNFGDRIRVIGGAVSSKLATPVDADARAEALDLPERYILTAGTLEPRKRLGALIASLAHRDSVDLPLLIAGPEGWGGVDVAAVAADHGLAPDRVRTLGFLPDADLAVVIARASAFVHPSVSGGFPLPVIEAFSFGVPVVHSDDPSVVEVAADAGVAVEASDDSEYPARLARAISDVVSDKERASRLSLLGQDRSRAYAWDSAAREVWNLHAEL
ncbi:glycosyltransferase family 4 protein [Salinibacterium sp. GXW1014]|uniref:glycosyltransferase family 4 protein n=1 Tax=Salinibacterium sp. GXW1014 TaxID=3377838 RepID=UPI00383A7F20